MPQIEDVDAGQVADPLQAGVGDLGAGVGQVVEPREFLELLQARAGSRRNEPDIPDRAVGSPPFALDRGSELLQGGHPLRLVRP
jgi:hypothetical protein